MRFKREKYLNKLYQAIENTSLRLIFLTGPRDSGKTTILKQVYEDNQILSKKHYFSFDQSIVSKQFADAYELKKYMEIKLGIDFHAPSLLMLNEIQYSKDLIKLLIQLTNDEQIQTKIIATSVTDIDQQLLAKVAQKSTTIHVYPLDFFEFLEDKQIHTQYFNLHNFSKILLQEIQPYFQEYLIWGGYPAVVAATTQEQKIASLKDIMRKIFEKDAGFWFAKDHLLLFEDIISLLGFTAGNSFKLKQLQKTLQISPPPLIRYLEFFQNNHLFLQLPHFFSDKTREVTHQKKLYCIDTGLVSMLTDSYNLKVKSEHALKNFIFQELLINKDPEDKLRTYKKINMSEIDFLLEKKDGSLVPITITERDSLYSPKVAEGFLTQYGDRVRHRIKLCPLSNDKKTYEHYTLHLIPWCMAKQLYSIV